MGRRAGVGGGDGGIREYAIAREEAHEQRWGHMPGFPRYLLEALRRGERVVLHSWHIPTSVRPPKSGGKQFVLMPDDSFYEGVYGRDFGAVD